MHFFPENNGVYQWRREERERRGTEGADERDEDVEAWDRGRHTD